jgi:hypothetical protein
MFLHLKPHIVNAKEKAKYIVVSNMGTKPCLALLITQIITQNLEKISSKIIKPHIDAAYGFCLSV